MGWISKVAKMSPKALSKLRYFDREIANSGYLAGKSAEIVDKATKLALRTKSDIAEMLSSNHGPIQDLIRRESGRNPSYGYQAANHEIKVAEAHLQRLKEVAPKAYQRVKDFIQTSPTGAGVRRVRKAVQAMRDARFDRHGLEYSEREIRRVANKTKSLRSLKASAIRAVRSAGTDYDPRKLLKSASLLARRNLLPAAAAGAGVSAASRKPKAQGYAMGGVVPSRGQSLRTKVGNAVKGAVKGASSAYNTASDTYWNTVLGRGALASRFNPVRPLKYAAKMVGRNPAWRRAMGVASPVADAALGAEAYYALAKDYAKKSKEGKVNPDKLKGFAYGGMVSKKLSRKKKGK